MARHHVETLFGHRKLQGTILMAVEAEPGTPSVLTDAVEQFSQNVSRAASSDPRVSEYKAAVIGYYLDVMGHQLPRDVLKSELVSADEKTTLLLVQPTHFGNTDFRRANEFLEEFCSHPPSGYTLHITGMPALGTGNGCFSGVHAEVNPNNMQLDSLAKAETCTMPLSLLVIAFLLRYHRLLLLPLLVSALSFALCCLFILPWMDKFAVPMDGFSVLGSVVLAMSLDYSLFILSRFSENHVERFTLQGNIDIVKACTCRTIVVSGSLVAIAFFCGILLPAAVMAVTSVVMGVAAVACMITTVIFLPAVLIIFGKFFVGASFLPTQWGDVQLHGYVEDDDTNQNVQLPQEDDTKLWLGIMRLVERSPIASLLAVLVIMSPLMRYCFHINLTVDQFAMMPTGSPAVRALRRIQDNFPVGIMDPYEILITAPQQPQDLMLSVELRDGLQAVGSHDLRPLAPRLGLKPEALAALTAAAAALARDDATRCSGLECFQQITQGFACLNVTGSTPKVPHCTCCPNAFFDCRRCALETKCSETEMREFMQAAPKDKGELQRLADCLQAVKSQDFSAADLRHVLDAAKVATNEGVHLVKEDAKLASNKSKEFQAKSESKVLNSSAAAAFVAAVAKVEQTSNHSAEFLTDGGTVAQKVLLDKYPFLVDVVAAIQRMSDAKHGMLLLPSGYAAILKLCDTVLQVGKISSMLGPAWLYNQRVDWITAVAANTNSLGQELLGWYVEGNHALLQIHTTFPSMGAGSANWIVAMRKALAQWEDLHPGYKAELSAGGGEVNVMYWVDMKDAMVMFLWKYLSISTLLIMAVVYVSFQSVLIPLRLGVALFFTLAATYGATAMIYQTPLLHGVFPNLRYFDGIYFEVVPLVTGLVIALGLDYDIFLISRIVEFRMQRYSDRASIFRGVLKTGNVISGAGMIMTFSFSGLLFADKVFFSAVWCDPFFVSVV